MPTSDLPLGIRRTVELFAVLAHEPSVLLLDEPSAGLQPSETAAFAGLVRRIRTERACSMLLIEHDVPLVATLADRLVLMELGRLLISGPPDDILQHPEFQRSYLGSSDQAGNVVGPAGIEPATEGL